MPHARNEPMAIRAQTTSNGKTRQKNMAGSTAQESLTVPNSSEPQAQAPIKRNSTTEVLVASMIGTAIEFYDNYCY